MSGKKKLRTSSFQCNVCKENINWKSYSRHIQDCVNEFDLCEQQDYDSNVAFEIGVVSGYEGEKLAKLYYEDNNEGDIELDEDEYETGNNTESSGIELLSMVSLSPQLPLSNFQFNSFEDELFLFFESEMSKNKMKILNKLRKHYASGISLRAFAESVSANSLSAKIITDGSTILIRAKSCNNEVYQLHRRFKNLLNKYEKLTIVSNKINISSSDGLCESLITYRPFINLLQNWMNDIQWTRLSFIVKTPLNKPSRIKYRTYCDSNEYRRIYNSIQKKYKKSNIFLLPLIVWTDGVEICRSRKLSAHPVMLSTPIAATFATPHHTLGFTEIKTKYKCKNKIQETNLRHELTREGMLRIFQELTTIQNEGGVTIKCWGNEVRMLPYLAFHCADSVEAKKVMAVSGCPYGFGRKICESNPYGYNDAHCTFKMGNRDMKQFQFDHSVKEIETFHDRFENSDVFGFNPCLPDPMHCIQLCLGRKLLYLLFESIKGNERIEFLNRMEKIEKNISHIITKVKTILATEVTKLIVLIPIGISDLVSLGTIWKEIMSCLGILVLIASKEELDEYDMELTRDAITTLKSILQHIDGFDPSDSTHYTLDHVFEQNILYSFGAPRFYSCSKFERSLQRVKQAYVVSNHKKSVADAVLERDVCLEYIENYSEKEFQYNIDIEPNFIKLICCESFDGNKCNKFYITYVDENRGRLTLPSFAIKLRSFNVEKTKSRNSIVDYQDNKLGIIQYCKVTKNQEDVHEKVTFLADDVSYNCQIVVNRLIQCNFKKYDPHPSLWISAKVSNIIDTINIDCIKGSCFHVMMDEKLWICTKELSSILVEEGRTVLKSPDIRFNNQ